jgi:HlyD family secretion protein
VFSGTIKEISQNAEFTPRQSITQRERANQVFAVKVQIDNTEDSLKPGMPADVVIK